MQVKVWNDNIHKFQQKFKDDDIVIPAGKFIEMDQFEATEFLGKYYPMVIGADNLQDPKSYKQLRIEKPAVTVMEMAQGHKCQGCGGTFPSSKALETHTDEFHSEHFSDPELAKKRGPGRPPKQATA